MPDRPKQSLQVVGRKLAVGVVIWACFCPLCRDVQKRCGRHSAGIGIAQLVHQHCWLGPIDCCRRRCRVSRTSTMAWCTRRRYESSSRIWSSTMRRSSPVNLVSKGKRHDTHEDPSQVADKSASATCEFESLPWILM